MKNPAEQLLDKRLQNGWTVVEKLKSPPEATGGNFSHGYIVESDKGVRAYLKALDFSRAFLTRDPALSFQQMTEAFNFERQICELCKKEKLSRVVMVIEDGKVQLDPDDPYTIVQYLIFELADTDVRGHIDIIDGFDLVFILRSLHHIAIGLKQLHTAEIAHQDLKPSNVLVFKEKSSKIADLGCAVVTAVGKVPKMASLEWPSS